MVWEPLLLDDRCRPVLKTCHVAFKRWPDLALLFEQMLEWLQPQLIGIEVEN